MHLFDLSHKNPIESSLKFVDLLLRNTKTFLGPGYFAVNWDIVICGAQKKDFFNILYIYFCIPNTQ